MLKSLSFRNIRRRENYLVRLLCISMQKVMQIKQVQRDIGSTMDIAKGLAIQSTIEYAFFLEAIN